MPGQVQAGAPADHLTAGSEKLRNCRQRDNWCQSEIETIHLAANVVIGEGGLGRDCTLAVWWSVTA